MRIAATFNTTKSAMLQSRSTKLQTSITTKLTLPLTVWNTHSPLLKFKNRLLRNGSPLKFTSAGELIMVVTLFSLKGATTSDTCTNKKLRIRCMGLPIYASRIFGTINEVEERDNGWEPGYSREINCYGLQYPLARSEERRVGKEGRSRWSPYH